MPIKILFFLSLLTLTISFDYCKLNCGSIPHIGCNHKGVFDTGKCAKWQNVKLVDLSQEEIELIVSEHNKRRSETAIGNAIPGVTATKMEALKWHAELAKIAAFNALLCLDDHDECRNTEEFSEVGQNIYNSFNSKPLILRNMITKSTESWYSERKLVTDINHIKKLPEECHGIGHFTQMVWSDTSYVGCAIAMWNNAEGYFCYYICNYDSGNIVGYPVLNIGAVTSECEPHKDYPGLCASKEKTEDRKTTNSPTKQTRKYSSIDRKYYYRKN